MFAQYRQTGEIGCKITLNYSNMQISAIKNMKFNYSLHEDGKES